MTTKKTIREQTIADYGGELFDAMFDGVREQQGLSADQQRALVKYIGGALDKRDELVNFVRRWENEVAYLRDTEKSIAERRKSIEGFLSGLREFISLQMQSWAGENGEPVILKRIVGKLHMFILKQAEATVEIEDEKLIPEQFIEYKPVVDKRSVKEALEAGKEVLGARLVPGKHFVDIR